jgi:type VI secretion system protein VasI
MIGIRLTKEILMNCNLVAGLVLFALVFCTSAGRCLAQDMPAQLQNCEKISEDISRLQCFDDLVKQAGLSPSSASAPPTTPAPESSGNWTVHQSKNPLDDSETVVLRNDSTAGVREDNSPITLILRCRSGELDMYIIWGYYLGSDNMDTSIRIGSGQLTDQSWILSSDNDTAFAPNPGTLIRGLLSASSLVVQVTPYDHSPVLATFDLSGLSDSIGPLAKDCKLKL